MVLDPPVCAVYTAPSGGDPGGGKKKEYVTITCTVDDPGTVAPDDDPVTAQIQVMLR